MASPLVLSSPPGIRTMSSSSNAPNGLPWLAEDNSIGWQEQVMAYLQRKQISQYVLGWTRYLAPVPPNDLTDAERAVPANVQVHTAALATWVTTYDEWKIKDSMAMGVIKGTLRGQYLTYVIPCTTSKAVWDTILGMLKAQNLGLAAHNTKQLLLSHSLLQEDRRTRQSW